MAGERESFEDVATGLAGAIEGLLGDDQRASDILGSIKSAETLERLDEAADSGRVLSASRSVSNPAFPDAIVRTPVVVAAEATDSDVYMREMFGPVVYLICDGLHR